MLIVAQRLAVGRLALLAKMAAARLRAVERVQCEQFAELDIVRDASGVVERLVDVRLIAGDRHVLPELVAQGADTLDCRLEAGLGARHSRVIPKRGARRAMEV